LGVVVLESIELDENNQPTISELSFDGAVTDVDAELILVVCNILDIEKQLSSVVCKIFNMEGPKEGKE
jgi:hypothetical protein